MLKEAGLAQRIHPNRRGRMMAALGYLPHKYLGKNGRVRTAIPVQEYSKPILYRHKTMMELDGHEPRWVVAQFLAAQGLAASESLTEVGT